MLIDVEGIRAGLIADREALLVIMRALDDAIAALDGHRAGSAPPPQSNGMNGATGGVRPNRAAEVLHAILMENPRPWTLPEATAEAQRRGWQSSSQTPQAIISQGLAKLVQEGRAKRVSRGAYQIAQPAIRAMSAPGLADALAAAYDSHAVRAVRTAPSG